MIISKVINTIWTRVDQIHYLGAIGQA